jgi:C4-type Zn-finger protein
MLKKCPACNSSAVTFKIENPDFPNENRDRILVSLSCRKCKYRNKRMIYRHEMALMKDIERVFGEKNKAFRESIKAKREEWEVGGKIGECVKSNCESCLHTT